MKSPSSSEPTMVYAMVRDESLAPLLCVFIPTPFRLTCSPSFICRRFSRQIADAQMCQGDYNYDHLDGAWGDEAVGMPTQWT